MTKLTTKLAIFVTIAATLALSAPLFAADDESTQNEQSLFTATRAYLREAEEFIAEKEYAKAAKIYRKAEKIQETDAEKAHFLYLAAQNFLLGKKDHSARDCYFKLLDNYIYCIPLENVLEQLRELADAYERGDGTIFGLKDPDAAIEIYKVIIKHEEAIQQSLDDRLTLAAKLEKNHKPEEAVNAYQEIIKLLPNNPDTRYGLAKLLDKMAAGGDSDGVRSRAAIREAKRFISLAAADPRRSDAERIIQVSREREGDRLLERAEFYLVKYHRKPDVARRYLLDIRREFSDTPAGERAEQILKDNFPEEK